MHSFFSLRLLFASLLLILPAYAVPVTGNNTSSDGVKLTTLERRDDIQTTIVDGGFKFHTCLPCINNHMCTVAFLQNSNWVNANLYLYDQTCKSLLLNGKDAQGVTRQQLATEMPSDQGSPLPSSLEKPLYVWVDAEWDGTDNHKIPAF